MQRATSSLRLAKGGSTTRVRQVQTPKGLAELFAHVTSIETAFTVHVFYIRDVFHSGPWRILRTLGRSELHDHFRGRKAVYGFAFCMTSCIFSLAFSAVPSKWLICILRTETVCALPRLHHDCSRTRRCCCLVKSISHFLLNLLRLSELRPRL